MDLISLFSLVAKINSIISLLNVSIYKDIVGLLDFGDDDMIKLVPNLFALKNNKILTQGIYVLLQYSPN